MKFKSSQTSFFKRTSDKFGNIDTLGRQRTTVTSRGKRPVSTTTSMHLVLKSKHAVGEWSLLKGNRRHQVQNILYDVAQKYGVKILSGANVGNHIHLHIRVYKRWQYLHFIRVLTARIALLVTGACKNKSLKTTSGTKFHFWSQRPITRFVHGVQDYLKLEDYILINQLEGFGAQRKMAEFFVLTRPQLFSSA